MYAQSYTVSAIAIDESQARETENAVEKDYLMDDEELHDEVDVMLALLRVRQRETREKHCSFLV